MQAAELKRALMSLAIANDVLKKEPESKDVSESDAFVFNGDFKHKLYRVRLREMLPKEVQEESERVNVQVAVDRQYQIDAAVVRIMKARKALVRRGGGGTPRARSIRPCTPPISTIDHGMVQVCALAESAVRAVGDACSPDWGTCHLPTGCRWRLGARSRTSC